LSATKINATTVQTSKKLIYFSSLHIVLAEIVLVNVFY